jgi:Fic family protein
MMALIKADVGPLVGGKYHHWHKLRYHQPPGDLKPEEWWWAIKQRRMASSKEVPLKDIRGSNFRFSLVDPIPERLHIIDQGAGGYVQMPDQITNPDTRAQYYVGSLMEEAITSSQLEGAVTTREVAKEMIRTGRSPTDNSEQMIFNNYRTMQSIKQFKDEPLTPDLVFHIHRLITQDTLPDPSAAGRLRRPDEYRVVADNYGEIFHQPPKHEELERRMAAMCEFANSNSPGEFIHPTLRSIILHFWLAYDHPFVDGNGRTARALFYWSMLRHNFWLCEFISISRIIVKAPSQYQLAFLYTETDDNDLTYFILHQLGVILKSIDELHDYIKRKTAELKALESALRGVAVLNHRQRALISHVLRHPNHRYTIEGHRASHKIVYETARTDLLDLQKRGLFNAEKVGRTWSFTPVAGLEKKLATL